MQSGLFCVMKHHVRRMYIPPTPDKDYGCKICFDWRNFIYEATGIVRRIDDLGRVVIPKEIRRTMRIREGDPLQITLAPWQRFSFAMLDLARRSGW